MHVSNLLLQVWLEFIAIAVAHGIAWIMEHPAPSRNVPRAASVWYLPFLKQLEHRGAVPHLVLQGLYGAASCKPTIFMTYRLRAFSECKQRWILPSWKRQRWQVLQGLDAAGNWRTTAAKAYPRNINMTLVEALIQKCIALASNPVHVSGDAFEELSDALVKIQAAMATSGHVMGHDFAG